MGEVAFVRKAVRLFKIDYDVKRFKRKMVMFKYA